LVDSGDSIGVIRLVERWLEYGTVSQTARIAQAKAFMDLRLMDRAWVRLREALAADPESIEAHLLTVEMFVQRGWPGKAERHLQKIDLTEAGSEEVKRYEDLVEAAGMPPNGPPSNAQEIERSGTADDVLNLADQYLSVGMLVRAESLLERLLRDGYTRDRVSTLLWGVRADFLSANQSTEVLLDELEQDIRGAEWSAIELTDGLGQVEVTAHVDLTEVGDGGSSEPPKRGFPSLFRRDDPSVEPTAPDEEEVTMSSIVVDEDDQPMSFDSTDSEGTPTPGGGDTRIMEVIQRGGSVGLTEAQGPIHRSVDDDASSSIDLHSHRARYLPPDDETFLEDEDQDLIVMTRRETAPVSITNRKKDVIEVLRASHVRAGVERRQESDLGALETQVQREADLRVTDMQRLPDVPRSPDPDTDDMLAEMRPARGRFQQIGVNSLVVLFLVVVCGWFVVSVLQWIARGHIIQETHETIARGDFRALQELEAKIEGQLSAKREPIAVREIELSLVRAVLWSQYTGDSDRMLASQDGLARAREGGAPDEEIRLVDAFLSWAMGDHQKARSLVDGLPMGDVLQEDIVARVALSIRSDEDSRALLERLSPIDDQTSLVELLSRERLLTALDELEEAWPIRERLLSQYGNNPFVQIARFHEQWDDGGTHERLALLADVMEGLPGPVSPRQEGRLHEERARLLADQGEVALAEQSWSAALILDPAHPRYLYHSASRQLIANNVIGALNDLDRCLGARPWDFSCRRGMIQALLELDRLETARQSVDAWRDARTPVLSAWVSMGEGKFEEAVGALSDPAGTHLYGTLAAYVRGMSLYELGSPKASASLGQVIEVWEGIAEPMTQILVGRARVARALMNNPIYEIEPFIMEWAPGDPVVYVMLAREMERSGQRASAGRLYVEAASKGPQSAMAQHALGLFWFDPQGDLVGARDIWRQYLDLQPNGDRARRARARMGRR